MPLSPDFALERELGTLYQSVFVAGLDEAGRGALAGPVYAAAVIFPHNMTIPADSLAHVTDSKLMTAAAREALFPYILEQAVAFGIGFATAETIDTIGILPATRQAMAQAVNQLNPAAEALLIDGRIRLYKLVNLPQRDIIRGDQKSVSIAAASILAKVSRDRHMAELHHRYPDYSFNRHKGYGTAAHLAALQQFGPCPEHRHSFAPLRTGLF